MSCTAIWRKSTQSYFCRLFLVLELKIFLWYFWPKWHPLNISLFTFFLEHRSFRNGAKGVGWWSAIRSIVSATATPTTYIFITEWHIMCFGGAYPRRNRLRHFCAICDGVSPTLETNAHDTYEQGINCLKASPLSFWNFFIYFSVVACVVDTLIHERLVLQPNNQCFIMGDNGVGVNNYTLTKSIHAHIFQPVLRSEIMICVVCWCYLLPKKPTLPIFPKLIWEQTNTAVWSSFWLWTRKHLVFDIIFFIG